MEITSRSLMKIGDSDEKLLFFRAEADIKNVIAYVLLSSGPFYVGGSGLFSKITVDAAAKEFMNVQEFYRKTNGIRIRHEYINISKIELTAGLEDYQIIWIAVMMSNYYLYKGFQNVYGIADRCDEYSISFPVSVFDGSKYHFNKRDILADENACLRAICQFVVTGIHDGYDMRMLEFYPYSFNLLNVLDQFQS